MEARPRQASARAEEVAHELADPETARNPAKLKKLGREHARLDGIRQTHQRLERLRAELGQAREVLQEKDPELAQLARADVERLRPDIERLERELTELLAPTDPLDDRDAIVEIRAGTGGDEAALFAAELFRMYTRFAEQQRWKVEVLSLSEGNLGGLKEAVFAACGRGCSTAWSPSRRRCGRGTAAPWSAPATARPRSAPTTFRRTASPIIASTTPSTTSRPC